MINEAVPELLHFESSHYNEVARWALDYKGVGHRRRGLLPGPHAPVIKRLTGKTETPVLVCGDRVVPGSLAIVDYLESTYPEWPLYPSDPGERAEALAIAGRFAAEVGPRIRCALFHHVFPDARYAASIFTQSAGQATRFLYAAAFPLMRAFITRTYGISEQSCQEGIATTREALDFIAGRTDAEGYLVGDRFSVADLVGAALVSMTVFPPEMNRGLPEPRSEGAERWLAEWRDHPAGAWIAAVYRKHRRPERPAELAA